MTEECIAESKSMAHEFVGNQFMVVQTAAILEVLHPLLGWVKGDIFACVAQVCLSCMLNCMDISLCCIFVLFLCFMFVHSVY